MALFALINENGIVENVAVISENKLVGVPRPVPAEVIANRDFLTDVVGKWVETSEDGSFRKKCASKGDTYDEINDVFIAPQPYPSWSLDSSFDWQPPTPMPADEAEYVWDEENLNWKELN